MMRIKLTLIILCILSSNIFAQKNSQDYYNEDESFHKSEIKKFISTYNQDFNDLIYVSSLNYSFDKTTFLFINKDNIKLFSLKNKKFEKKVSSKKINLKSGQEKELMELIKKPDIKINKSDCFKDGTIHHYKIEFFIQGRKIETSSRCLKALSQNKLFNYLMELLEL